jgi:hypothetical protein
MVAIAGGLNSPALTLQRFNDSRGDGPTIPTALKGNPFLTISALAERIVENIVASLSHSPHGKA